jgi:hypothetical protein
LNRILIFISIIAATIFAYNLDVSLKNRFEFGGDASDFIHLGLTLAKTGKYGHLDISHKELVEGFKNRNHKERQYAFAGHSNWRPPLWPLIIASCFLVSGYSLSFLIVFKFFLHLVGGLFFYKTLGYFKIRKILIYFGVLIYLVSPAWQLYSRVFLSEPITLFLMTLFIWTLVRFLKKGNMLWLNGLCGGVLILAHPYYIFLPFSLWFFLFLFKKVNLMKFFLFGAITFAALSIWIVRNYVVLGTENLVITTSSGASLAKGWNKDVPNLHTNTKGDLADETLVLQNFDYDSTNYQGEVGSMKLYQKSTFHFIKSNPELIMPIIKKKLQSAFNPLPETARPGVLEAGRVIYQILALLAGLILIWKGSGMMKALVLGLYLSTILISILTYSGFRFRMPQSSLEIFFIILTVHLILETYSKYRIKGE